MKKLVTTTLIATLAVATALADGETRTRNLTGEQRRAKRAGEDAKRNKDHGETRHECERAGKHGALAGFALF